MRLLAVHSRSPGGIARLGQILDQRWHQHCEVTDILLKMKEVPRLSRCTKQSQTVPLLQRAFGFPQMIRSTPLAIPV